MIDWSPQIHPRKISSPVDFHFNRMLHGFNRYYEIYSNITSNLLFDKKKKKARIKYESQIKLKTCHRY